MTWWNPTDALNRKVSARNLAVVSKSVLDNVIEAIRLVSKKEALPTDQLWADLMLDSLDMVEVQMTLEELYRIKNSDFWDDFWKPRILDWAATMSYSATVKDLAEFLEKYLWSM